MYDSKGLYRDHRNLLSPMNFDIEFKKNGPAFSHYRMDEGPVLNKLGRLLLLLHILGLKSPTEVFENRAPAPKWKQRRGL